MPHLRRARRPFSSCHILILCHLILQIYGTESAFLQSPNGQRSGNREDNGIVQSGSESGADDGSDAGGGGGTKDFPGELDFAQLFNDNRNNLPSNSRQLQPRHFYPASPEGFLQQVDALDRVQDPSFNENIFMSRLLGRQQDSDKFTQTYPWDSQQKLGPGPLLPMRQGSSRGRGFNYPNGNNYYNSLGRPHSVDGGGGFESESDLNAGAPYVKEVKRTPNSSYFQCHFKLCPSGLSGKRRIRPL